MTCAPSAEHAQTTTSGSVQRLHAWPAMVQRLIWGSNGMPSSSGGWLTCHDLKHRKSGMIFFPFFGGKIIKKKRSKAPISHKMMINNNTDYKKGFMQ